MQKFLLRSLEVIFSSSRVLTCELEGDISRRHVNIDRRRPPFSLEEKSMEKLKQLTAGVLLCLMLSISGFAGDIHIPGPQPPPSGSSSAITAGETAKPGDIGLPGAPSDSVTDAALNLLQTFFTVF
jgi:hypothetical protein